MHDEYGTFEHLLFLLCIVLLSKGLFVDWLSQLSVRKLIMFFGPVCTEWGEPGDAYSLSNEGRTATRTGEGLTTVLHSASSSYTAGDTLILRILDSSDVSPGDGLAIVCDKQDEDSCNRSGAIFVNTYGELCYKISLDEQVFVNKVKVMIFFIYSSFIMHLCSQLFFCVFFFCLINQPAIFPIPSWMTKTLTIHNFRKLYNPPCLCAPLTSTILYYSQYP